MRLAAPPWRQAVLLVCVPAPGWGESIRYASFQCKDCTDGTAPIVKGSIEVECDKTRIEVGSALTWFRWAANFTENITSGLVAFTTVYENSGLRSSKVAPLCMVGNRTEVAPFGDDQYKIQFPSCPFGPGRVEVSSQVPLGHCAPPGIMETTVSVTDLTGTRALGCINVTATVEDHPSGPGHPCGDDEYGILRFSSKMPDKCSDISSVPCSARLQAAGTHLPESLSVGDVCKQMCERCGESPVQPQSDCYVHYEKEEDDGLQGFTQVFVGGGMCVVSWIVVGVVWFCNRQRLQRGRQLAEAQQELKRMREQERVDREQREKEMKTPLNKADKLVEARKPRRPRGRSAVPHTWQRVQLLGKGSFGKVYLGLRPDGSFFAVKVLELSKDTSAEKMEELMREVDVMSRLAHEHIVEYYGCTYEARQHELHIFMEFEQGGSVGALVRRMELPLSCDAASCYMQQILLGVTYLHSQDVIHRDLKGDNVLLSAEGTCKLADFGTSKRTADGAAATITGTPAWMAPEVISAGARGAGREPGQTYSFAADIWSCGIILCELLNRGKPPWPRFESAWQAAFTIGSWNKELPPEVPEVSELCRSFMLKCLNPRPELRPSAQTLLRHPFVRGAKVRRMSAAPEQIRTGADIMMALEGKKLPRPDRKQSTPVQGRAASSPQVSDSDEHGSGASAAGSVGEEGTRNAGSTTGCGSRAATPKRATLRPPALPSPLGTLADAADRGSRTVESGTREGGTAVVDTLVLPPAAAVPIMRPAAGAPPDRPPDAVVRGTLASSWSEETASRRGAAPQQRPRPTGALAAAGSRRRPPNASEAGELLRMVHGHF